MDLSSPVVQSFILYSAILALKLIAVASLTTIHRMIGGIFSNPEDVPVFGFGKGKVNLEDPSVERVRRAHRNDLENIPAFWILGALYLTTSPNALLAVNLFRVFTLFRILHTIAYAVIPQLRTKRGMFFGVPSLINLYMGASVMFYYLTG